MTSISSARAHLGFSGTLARRRLTSFAIVAGVLLLWQLAAVTVFAHRFVLPSPVSVWTTMVDDNFYAADVGSTLSIAWKGWLLGNGAALVLAGICLVFPVAEGGLMTLGVATYCVPTIAVGPLLVVLYGDDGAKIVMSALSVFFVTLVAAVTGLRAASPTTLEAVRAFGGGSWAQLFKVRLRASIPTLASGLAIAAPAAILGTMIGDYLGGQTGLGVIMLQAQQQLAVSRTWGIAVVSTAVCGLAFALTAALARRVGADVDAPLDAGMTRTRADRGRLAAAAIAAAKLVGAVASGLLAWEVLIKTSGLGPYFVKSPADVWRYLFTSAGSAANRHTLLTNLGQTARDAGSGWVAGTAAAILVAFALILLPSVGAAVMPFVIVLRSVPLIAMCPLLGLVFGRGLTGVTIIAGLVTFVPSLVTIAGGLRTAPSAATDVVYCGGGGTVSTLLKVRVPFALPEIFAAAKISMPGAVLGSVLAEWLITAHGLGYAMAYDIISSNYNDLFASIAALVAISLGLYAIVGTIESLVRERIRGS